MKEKNTVIAGITGLLALFLVQPALAHSWGERSDRFHHHHRYPTFGFHISFLPRDYVTIVVGDSRYYYCEGVYYQRINRDYVVIAPPYGAVIRYLPPNCSRVKIGGRVYFVDDDTYYVMVPRGYQIVPPPVEDSQTIVSSPVVNNASVTTNNIDSYTVNIPNSQGGFTPVIIKRGNGGYLGPQGEFYAEFPRVDQLKAMYVK